MDPKCSRPQITHLYSLCRNDLGYVDEFTKEERCGQYTKIHQLKTDLAACTQDELDIVDFYSKLLGMRSDLGNYVKVSYCTCGKCKCKLNKRISIMFEEERAHQFLMGLNEESFSTSEVKFLPDILYPLLTSSSTQFNKKSTIGR